MYTANSPKELKKLLKNNNFPILTTDPKTIKTILYMDALKARNNKKKCYRYCSRMGDFGNRNYRYNGDFHIRTLQRQEHKSYV